MLGVTASTVGVRALEPALLELLILARWILIKFGREEAKQGNVRQSLASSCRLLSFVKLTPGDPRLERVRGTRVRRSRRDPGRRMSKGWW